MNFGGTLEDAVALVRSGQMHRALEEWTQEMEPPALRDRLLLIGEACSGLGRQREGLDILLKALDLDPQHVQCLCATGEAYLQCHLPKQAFERFFKATQLAPQEAAAWNGLGYVFLKTNKFAEAETCLQRAFEIQPDSPDTSNRLGLLFLEQKKFAHAVRWFLNSIRLKPDFSQAWSNLAVAWRFSNEIPQAIRACKNALKIEPTSAAHWTNLGVLHQEQNEIAEALFAYRKAISLDETFYLAHVNEGIALLLMGDLLAGWAKYEYRWLASEKLNQRHMKLPLWKGNEPLEGKTILLHSDQGFGDTIQCLRFVPLLLRMGAIIHVEVNPVLVETARLVEGVVSAVSLHAADTHFDFQCPFLSLPFACKISLETLPYSVPYLRPSPGALEKWNSAHIPANKLKVALVWRGNPNHDNDKNRSLSLEALKPLLELEDCEFFNLQWGLTAYEGRMLAPFKHFHDVMPHIKTFDDTAAFLTHVDLVISVDTAVAHLAGALAKHVWILLPFAPDWRWMLDRLDSPWYPTARLFRQTKAGDWGTLISEVASRLKALLQDIRMSTRG
jgi:tetratricopeptide (TPR) repeat protein